MRLGSKRGRGRRGVPRLLFLWAVGVAGCASGAPASARPNEASAQPAAAPSDERVVPSFTADQAARGQRTFTTVCSVCHGRTEFTGPIFALTWMAEPVGHLFQHISTAMPQDKPGSLSAEEYAAVVAYILQLNGRPTGDRVLPTDVELLDKMQW